MAYSQLQTYNNPMKMLKTRAANLQSQKFNFEKGMAQEQWDWQKKIYRQQQDALSQFGGLGGLIEQFTGGFQSANAANEARYKEAVGIADSTVDQRSRDIESSFGGQLASGLSRLAGLGMGNTTVANTLRTGVEREKQAALDRSKQQLAGMRIGVRERRQDIAPDMNALLGIVGQLGAGGGPAGITAMLKAFQGMGGGGSMPQATA
jgi:hypothetical protein